MLQTMNLLDRWFGAGDDQEPVISFGRHGDAQETAARQQHWEASQAAFRAADYLVSCRSLLQYMSNPEGDNLSWRFEQEQLHFSFFQGSKKISGQADHRQLRAQVRLGRLGAQDMPELSLQLLARNASFYYCRYAIDDERCICLVFDTLIQDAAPSKLYNAFRELAIAADKLDDLLLDSFPQVAAVESEHLQAVPPDEQRARVAFIRERVASALRLAGDPLAKISRHPQAISYVLLDALFRIDYLTRPEGIGMESLERAQRLYFDRFNKRQIQARNALLAEELQLLASRSEACLSREMYRGIYTFGITQHVSHERVVQQIDHELPNIAWYLDQECPLAATAIAGYVIGYCLFNFSLPPVDKELFHLYYRITEPAFFADLGFAPAYAEPATGKPLRRPIRQALDKLAEKQQDQNPKLQLAVDKLVFDDLARFSYSYLQMIHQLRLNQQ